MLSLPVFGQFFVIVDFFFFFLDKTQGSFLRNVPTEVLKVKRAYLTPTNKPQTMGSTGPLFQNEGRCSAFDMEIIFHSHANKTHFHKKGCAPSLI